MLGRYFRDADQMDTIPAAVRGKMERIAAPLASVEGNEVWNLSSHVQDAIELTERARTAGGTLEDFMRQGGLLIEQEYSPQSIAFAKQLRDVNPNELVKSVRAYADDMRYSDKYEGPGMFGDLPEPKHPAAAFKDAFGVELPKGATMEPIERAKPKFASFNEQDFPVKAEAPPRPMKSTGSEALDTIRKARSETRLEHETGKILKKLREEPGEAFKQFIYQKDSGVEYLKKVAKLAPEDMPKVGRAVLQDLIGTATGEGGFDRARGIAAKWDAIGPETKAIIFKNPQLRADLDSFFLLAKKAAEVPNPSGTAVVGSLSAAAGYAFHDPITAAAWTISAAGMAKLLHSPAGVNALRNGLKVSLKRPVEASMAAARILKIAGDLAKPQQTERAKAKQ
jgi:DNA-directed RNA polymerase subunit F